MLLLISLLFVLPYPGTLKGAEIPSAEDVAAGKAALPTIGDLTGGKVKKGDIIDRSNVNLVKEWLTPGTLEAVNQGLVLIMGTNSKPYTAMPKAFYEITEKNRGKAVMDTTGAVYYEKIGTPWPGGIPYPEPKTGVEAMNHLRYGMAIDDYFNDGVLSFVNKEGKVYKNVGMSSKQIWVSTKTVEPPFGTVPGYEGQMFRRVSTLTSPIEVKGAGQFAVRYYDDAKRYDTGFMYFPSFKRTLRVSTTTWQDNIAGSDLVHGDSEAFREPYVDWNFKLVGTRYLLIPEHKAPFPYYDDKTNEPNPKLKFDVGRRWARMGWAVFPMRVVEAVPKAKHVYGKKMLYIGSTPYCMASGQAEIMEAFDRQGKIWKLYFGHNGDIWAKEGYTFPWGVTMTDLQSQHSTQFWFQFYVNSNFPPTDCTFKELLKRGR